MLKSQVVAVDGKTARRTYDRSIGKEAIHPDYLASVYKSEQWPGFQTVVMVRAERRVGDRNETETRYYISSLPSQAKQILKVAAVFREERILVTLDLDFADIRAYPPSEYPGFVVPRLKQQDKPHVLGVFSRLVGVFQEESVEGNLWIVEEERIRIRV